MRIKLYMPYKHSKLKKNKNKIVTFFRDTKAWTNQRADCDVPRSESKHDGDRLIWEHL